MRDWWMWVLIGATMIYIAYALTLARFAQG